MSMSFLFTACRAELVGALAAGRLLWVAPAGRRLRLPDGRVYEMVTPPENEGADVYLPIEPLGVAD